MNELPVLLGFTPLVLPAALILLGMLTGRISVAGLWYDSFQTDQLSPARVYQFIATLVAAAAVLIGLAHTGGTAFAPFPEWLFTAVGGGNIIYLGAKLVSLNKIKSTS